MFYLFSFSYPIFKMLDDNISKKSIIFYIILKNGIIKIMARKLQSIKLFEKVQILETIASSSV